MEAWRTPTPAEREPVEQAILDLASGHAKISDLAVKPWASVTFAGARYRMTVRFYGADAVKAGEDFITALPDHEFSIPGQLVADAAVAQVTHNPGSYLGASVELLLLDERQ